MERRSRSWALGLSFIGFFVLLFSLGFVQQVKAADDVADYGTVIGIVRDLPLLPALSRSDSQSPASHIMTAELTRDL